MSVSWDVAMRTRRFASFVVLLMLALPGANSQRNRGPGAAGQEPFGRGIDPRMPDGRSRTLIILKKDVERSSKDMARVVELATELQQEIERNQFHTVDLGSVRKAEEIIKLVRRVKGRLSKSQ